MKVHPIEAESYRILAERVDLTRWPPAARAVVARVIHAAADVTYADTLVVDEDACLAGIAALRAGAPVIADVEMVAVATRRAGTRCLLAEGRALVAAEHLDGDGGLTASAAAMRVAAARWPEGAVVVVGNAPTALVEVVRLAAAGEFRPALVIGLPVGFVGAADAKAALRASGLPSVSNVGERGGSAVAAAALNALWRLAVADDPGPPAELVTENVAGGTESVTGSVESNEPVTPDGVLAPPIVTGSVGDDELVTENVAGGTESVTGSVESNELVTADGVLAPPIVTGSAPPSVEAPTVHMVGAGPGDPMLLTRRAARLLAGADVVVLDRRSLEPIAALAPPSAERIFVGRTDGHPAWDIDAIADLLANRASPPAAGRPAGTVLLADRASATPTAGAECAEMSEIGGVSAHPTAGPARPVVVRLKSGDPFVCSRGGEEMAALAARGIHVDVTPGVTAATAAPLAAGVPRGRTVTILAGNQDPAYPDTDIAALADPDASLVVLVGRSRQAVIAAALIAAGLDPSTPAAVVHAATRPEARTVHTTLEHLGDHRLPPPATVVIGPARAHP